MLTEELLDLGYNKAAHGRALRSVLNDRSDGSVEFKHQNISAVMLGLGQPWITGYKPASQFQMSLVKAVLRRLKTDAIWLDPTRLDATSRQRNELDDFKPLWIGPPPTHSNESPAIDAKAMALIASRFDVAERDAENRKLGRAGEECVFRSEIAGLRAVGQSRLADQVTWTSDVDGDGAGFDIASFEPSGKPRMIEVKTTNGWDRTPFHISRNELAVADQNRDSWHLVRLWNFARSPKAFSIRPPLQSHVALTPTSFLASFR